MELHKAIYDRRSVRKFKDEPIDEALVEKLVDAARWAPSWANTQCVRYVVVRNPATKAKLADILSPNNPARAAVTQAPVVVVFVAKLGVSGCKKGQPVDDKAWHMFDTGMAMQNFCLAAHAEGLGTVVCGFFDYKAAGETLGVSADYQVVAFTPLGRPDGEANAPPREEIDDLVHYERF